MTPRVLGLAAAAALAAALVIAPAATPFSTAALIPVASAACPDAEVVFARGRQEPPGVGAVGDALVNSLRSKVGMSVGCMESTIPPTCASPAAPTICEPTFNPWRKLPEHPHGARRLFLGATAADLAIRGMPPGMDQHIAAVALSGSADKRLGPEPALPVGRSTSARTATPSVGEA